MTSDIEPILFGSVCSGIEAVSVAVEPLGMQAAWFAEIESYPSSVLAHHWPHVQNLGDMTTIAPRILSGELVAPDVLAGGTPCQAFSVAGLRAGLSDHRGQLTLSYVDLANAIDSRRSVLGQQPCVAWWENVPGVLSSKDNAFGSFLAGLAGESDALEPPGGKWSDAGCVFGPQRAVAWRVLDAQYFGLAQRRRRVFVVASARDGFDPCKVLFEFDGVRRDSAPSREAGKAAAGTLTSSLGRRNGVPDCGSTPGQLQPAAFHWDDLDNPHPTLNQSHNTGGIGASNQELISQRGSGIVPAQKWPAELASTLNAAFGSKLGLEDQHVNGGCPLFVPSVISVHGTQDPYVRIEQAHTLGRNNGGENAITYGIPGNWIGRAPANGGNATEPHLDRSPCLTSTDRHGVATAMAVRRLTPTECERLQGFPDGHTNVPYRGKPAADGPRYKALGNSMAVNCMRWIGRRITSQLEPLLLVESDAKVPLSKEETVVKESIESELRNQVIEHIDRMVRYWADLPGLSVEDRCDGVAFSILTMLDGAAATPRFTLAAESANRHEHGVIINADCDLHDAYTALRRQKGR